MLIKYQRHPLRPPAPRGTHTHARPPPLLPLPSHLFLRGDFRLTFDCGRGFTEPQAGGGGGRRGGRPVHEGSKEFPPDP